MYKEPNYDTPPRHLETKAIEGQDSAYRIAYM